MCFFDTLVFCVSFIFCLPKFSASARWLLSIFSITKIYEQPKDVHLQVLHSASNASQTRIRLKNRIWDKRVMVKNGISFVWKNKRRTLA